MHLIKCCLRMTSGMSASVVMQVETSVPVLRQVRRLEITDVVPQWDERQVRLDRK